MDTPVAAPPEQQVYGLIPLWVNGNIVSRATLVILVIMSLGSWFIIFTKVWDQRTLKKSAKIVEKNFWTADSIKEGVEHLPVGNDFRFIAEDGLRAASHHEGRLTDRIRDARRGKHPTLEARASRRRRRSWLPRPAARRARPR